MIPQAFTRAALALFFLIPALFPALATGAAQLDSQADSQADSSASILLYHRFGEDDIPTTNIRLAQFEAQIAELKNGSYAPARLTDIVAALTAGRALAPRTVAVTVDDAYKSVLREAWPRLRAAGIPLTVFVATDPVDNGTAGYMTWDDLRRLQGEGVIIGHHGAAHAHLVDIGLAAAEAEIRRASARFLKELGAVPTLFAYPFGEYDRDLMALVRRLGFDAALAQYSGAAAAHALFDLPRFPLNERYGGMARFRLVAGARALPAVDFVPAGPVLAGDAPNPPAFGFTLTGQVPGLGALACYPSHLDGPADMHRLGQRIEVRFDTPFPSGRNRINCTMPAGDGRWYWLGRFFYVP